MPHSRRDKEIDHRTIKLIVGVVALSIASLTSVFSDHRITSISASYYAGGWSQTIFIGFLFTVAAMLLAYNGYTTREMLLSKTASLSTLGVALFPCACDAHVPQIPGLHGVAAAVTFLILALFCRGFHRRARGKHHPQATARAWIYVACGIAILLSIAILAFDAFTHNALAKAWRAPRLTFYGEAAALVAFGVSWLTASRTLPLITRPEERFSPLSNDNPE